MVAGLKVLVGLSYLKSSNAHYIGYHITLYFQDKFSLFFFTKMRNNKNVYVISKRTTFNKNLNIWSSKSYCLNLAVENGLVTSTMKIYPG